jgi:hypothetical protein
VKESELVEKVGMTEVQARILQGNRIVNRSSEISVSSMVYEKMDWNIFSCTVSSLVTEVARQKDDMTCMQLYPAAKEKKSLRQGISPKV